VCPWSPRPLFGLICIILVIQGCSARAAEYRDLPLYTFGVSNSKLTLVLENEILVPSLSTRSMSDSDFSAILPYSGSIYAESMERTLRSRDKISLGHAMPYFYIAIHQALSRIYRNMVLVPRSDAREMSESFGLPIDTSIDLHANLRDLIPIKPIDGANLTIEIYSKEESFQRASSEIGLHSAKAFWDAPRSRIGLFVDHRLFALLPMKAAWGNQSIDQTIVHVRDYVIRRVLDDIGHELVHFVQYVTKEAIYFRPFLAEAGAMFVEQTNSLREEYFQIANGLTNKGLPVRAPPTGSPCRMLIDFKSPFLSTMATRVHQAIDVLKGKRFDLEKALTMDDRELYGRGQSQLQAQYDVALAAVYFAAALPRRAFLKHFGPLLEGKDEATVGAALAGLNDDFAKWLDEFPSQWWDHVDARQAYDQISWLVSRCLNASDYASAFSGALAMTAIRPQSPTGLLYAGDVFWRLQVPFYALDYYARAEHHGRVVGFADEPEIRVISRRGDAYEALGAIGTAVATFRQLEKFPIDSVDDAMLIVVLRSNLKRTFYEQIIGRGLSQDEQTLMLVNHYVGILQMSGCLKGKDRQRVDQLVRAMQGGRMAEFRTRLVAHSEALLSRIRTDVASTSIGDLVKKERRRCS
jgi:hypothetical protein